jgi:micrococcal nuclease
MTGDPYIRSAVVLRVVDGDTVRVRLDLGFDAGINLTLRLDGIDAPETDTRAGKDAAVWLAARLPAMTPVTVKTVKDRREKYGRYLATLYDGQGDVNAALVAAGHATPYAGGRRTPG